MAFFITQLAECGLGVPGCLQLARLQWGVRFPAVPFFQVHLPADHVAALRHASDFFSMDTVPRRAASSCGFRAGPRQHSGRCHATAAWGRDACTYAEPCMPAVRDHALPWHVRIISTTHTARARTRGHEFQPLCSGARSWSEGEVAQEETRPRSRGVRKRRTGAGSWA